jgi:hypothetical protein
MVACSSDPKVARLYQGYVRRGGKIQYIAQVNPTADDLRTSIRVAADAGAVGAFLLGNLGDRWTREGAVGRVGEVVATIQEYGLVAGVAGHALRTIKAIERALRATFTSRRCTTTSTGRGAAPTRSARWWIITKRTITGAWTRTKRSRSWKSPGGHG